MDDTAQREGRFRLLPMRPRDPDEPGRAASMLELFFDLVFVVAVGTASTSLSGALGEGDVVDGVLHFALVFFGIWWAWMNFTWFATSFDNDDWLYRVLTIVQMAGVLVLAAGIGPAFGEDDYVLLIAAYVVMRISMVAQWLRASRAPGSTRRPALRYAVGVACAQVLWVLALLLPDGAFGWVVPVLVLAEIAVPVIAERGATTPWHPHHITERCGCFTLIVLGESLLASANAIIEAVDEGHALAPLISLAVLALIVSAALWWIYFWAPHHRLIGSLGYSLAYGYGHYVIFGAAGALSAGIEAEIAALSGDSALEQPGVSFAYTVPVALFVLVTWLLVIRPFGDAWINTATPIAALVVLVDPIIPVPFALTAVVMALLVALFVWRGPSREAVEVE